MPKRSACWTDEVTRTHRRISEPSGVVESEIQGIFQQVQARGSVGKFDVGKVPAKA